MLACNPSMAEAEAGARASLEIPDSEPSKIVHFRFFKRFCLRK